MTRTSDDHSTHRQQEALMHLTTDVQMDLHRRMVRIRLFEEAAGKLAEAARAARLPAPVRRRGGRRGRRVRGVERRRPDHLDPSRARPPRRQGRRLQPDDGRADGQGHRLLQGQGRVDAHLRPRPRHARRQRDRRCRLADRRRRRRSPTSTARQRPGGGGVLRRRRHQHRRLPRGRQHGVRAASCPSCSSARTTSTASSHHEARRWRSPTSSIVPPATACPA